MRGLPPSAAVMFHTASEVPHLLDRDIEQHAAPAAHRRRLGGIQALPLAVLQAEGGVQVGAHEVVLELGGLVQAVDEDLALRAGPGPR